MKDTKNLPVEEKGPGVVKPGTTRIKPLKRTVKIQKNQTKMHPRNRQGS